MLRTAVTLLFLLPFSITLGSDAGADAIFALQWRDTGTETLTILPGDPAAGGQRTLDLVMTIDVQWVAFGVTVANAEGNSLSFINAERWDALDVPGASWNFVDSPIQYSESQLQWFIDQGFGAYQEAYDFVTLIDPPNHPPWGPPGTYVIGSIIVDTSSVLSGETIETFFHPGFDGLAIDDGAGSVVFSDDATFLNATLGTARLFVIPEPATAGLAVAGLLLLGLTRRRSRG